MKYRIAWRSLITGYTGHGEFILDRLSASEFVEKLNRQYRKVLVHWTEEG